MTEFTLDIYRELLEKLQEKGYELISYSDYCKGGWRNERNEGAQGEKSGREERNEMKKEGAQGEKSGRENVKAERKFVILRHDVDKKPENSVRTAQIEKSIGARASYYFRTPESGCYTGDVYMPEGGKYKGKQNVAESGCNNGGKLSLPEMIRSIVRLGHEIGYHYEDMALCGGDTEKAYSHFVTWLDYFRQYYAVETICMHGAPTNRYDGRELWKKYDYKALGIIGEPYFDTDFGDVLYLTDTGRCWDGYRISVRDKIPEYQEEWNRKGWSWHTTKQLLRAIEEDQLPAHVMMTTHPQRWTNNKSEWIQELLIQNIKNGIKFWINRSRRLHSSAAH